MKEKIETGDAPAAIGPYSQAVRVGDMLFVSGQIPVVPGTGEFAGDDIRSQTGQVLKNIKAILEAAGADMAAVVKTTVLLKDMAFFADMNDVYATFFDGIYPARATYQVVALPKNALVEIEAVACL